MLRGAVRDLSAGGALPLHLAASGGQAGTLQLLLATGAPLEATDGRDQTALQVGCCQGLVRNSCCIARVRCREMAQANHCRVASNIVHLFF